jgi:4-azaleucine resistance transporter AzlC
VTATIAEFSQFGRFLSSCHENLSIILANYAALAGGVSRCRAATFLGMTTLPQTPPPSAPAISVLTLSVPVAMGYVPLGMVFGFLFAQAGAPWWLALAASVFVFAGAAQFMMVPMLATGLSVATIALATLVVNLRHIFYGLSLLHKLPHQPWARWYLVFALTDETYSVLTTLPEGTGTRQMVLVALLNQGWWVLGTLLGAVIGAQAQITLVGLDFALAALFAVLAVEQWRSAESSTPLWVAVLSYLSAQAVAPQQALLSAIALSVLAGLVLSKPKAEEVKP